MTRLPVGTPTFLLRQRHRDRSASPQIFGWWAVTKATDWQEYAQAIRRQTTA